MTAQTSDLLRYKEKQYQIAAVEYPGGFFDIDSLGLAPEPMSTACWRGYVAMFAVDLAGQLLLERLLTNNARGKSPLPPINGMEPRIIKPEGLVPKYADYRDAEYDEVYLPIAYSGGILIADDFIRERYVHMGFQSPWSYKDVQELIFAKGVCTAAHDLSAVAEQRRREAMPSPPTSADAPHVLSQWVREAFDLGYARRR